MAMRDQADIADNFPILLPDIAGERHGNRINRAAGPPQEDIILPSAAHLLDIIATVNVHCIGETFLNEVGNPWQVAYDIEWTKLWDLSTDRDCDGSH
jgi:hypothetical protein